MTDLPKLMASENVASKTLEEPSERLALPVTEPQE
jgi:hypothetical protein